MTFKAAERIRETSTTTGTGTYTLAGAATGYLPFSSLAANNYTPYFASDGTNWEVGIGQYLAGPDRLTRDAVIASTNAGAAVNWGAGTRTLRCGWPAWLALTRYLTKSVAGGAGTTTLTQNEQRGHVLEFTGALTGNRILEVDATPWGPIVVYNNTSGAFTLTYRVTGQTGIVVPQGGRVLLTCDGTDVRALSAFGAPVTGALDLTGTGGGQIVFPAAQNASAGANTLDDYEEGTWTPSVGGTATYTVQVGSYTKIGRLVAVTMTLTINTIGSGSVSLISGLPFARDASAAISTLAASWTASSATAIVFLCATLSASSSTLALNAATAATTALNSGPTIFGNSAAVHVSGGYHA